MKKNAYTSLLIITAIIYSGCVVVPTERVKQPWSRELKTAIDLQGIRSLKIEVEGKTIPIPGSEILVAAGIKEEIQFLLERKGITNNDQTGEYKMKVMYNTYRQDMMRTANYSSFYSQNLTQSYSGSAAGLGISLAQSLIRQSSISGGESMQIAQEVANYIHAISAEVYNSKGELVWKVETTWDSYELDILSGIVPKLQILLSSLPSDPNYIPNVREVKVEKAASYFRLNCFNYTFVTPALPFLITFTEGSNKNRVEVSKTFDASFRSIKNYEALEAFVDLLQTAENALPKGNEKDWLDPLNMELWSRVTLGGRYTLGKDKKPINVIIFLEGKTYGYEVEECKVVDDETYEVFNNHMRSWKNALREYYNFYVQE